MGMDSTTIGEIKQSGAAAGAREYGQADIEKLVAKASGGNFQAFGDLYSIFLDRIYRYVYYQIHDKMSAEDLTEEVFVKAWNAIGSCHGREKTFSAWLYRIAHNHLVSTVKASRKFSSLDAVDLNRFADAKQKVETHADCKELLERIANLPENQKQVIILKFIEGMENREIAGVMGKREGAIRVLQMRALATLRKEPGVERNGQ